MKPTFACISAQFFLIHIKPRVLEVLGQATPSAHLVLCLFALTFMCVSSLMPLLKSVFSCARDLPLPLSRLSFKRVHRKIQILTNFIKNCERKRQPCLRSSCMGSLVNWSFENFSLCAVGWVSGCVLDAAEHGQKGSKHYY